jgi:hypothetical protein
MTVAKISLLQRDMISWNMFCLTNSIIYSAWVLCCWQLPFFVDILIPFSWWIQISEKQWLVFVVLLQLRLHWKVPRQEKDKKSGYISHSINQDPLHFNLASQLCHMRDFKTAGDQTTVCELYADQAEDDAMDKNHKKSICDSLDPCSQNWTCQICKEWQCFLSNEWHGFVSILK